MQEKVYNNPLFASGLARLVESYMPNPEKQARSEAMSASAALNRQRLELNQMKMEQSLGDMVGRSMGGAIQGSGDGSTPTSAPSLAPGATPTRDLTQSELTRVARFTQDAGFEGADASRVVSAIIESFNSGNYATLDEAAGNILPDIKYDDVVTETIPNEWMDGDGGLLGDLLLDAFRGPEEVTERQLVIPQVGTPAAPAAAAAPAASITEGAVARAPDGSLHVFQNGQWVPK